MERIRKDIFNGCRSFLAGDDVCFGYSIKLYRDEKLGVCMEEEKTGCFDALYMMLYAFSVAIGVAKTLLKVV